MTDKELCSGCYMWENHKVGSNCNLNPISEVTNEIICPCVTCLVKSMCTENIPCNLYTEAFVTGE